MSRRLTVIGCAMVLAAGLAGCGKVGDLERPGPLFGAKGRAADAPPPQDPTRPVETVDPRDRSTDNLPARAAPIPGSGAVRPPPPGALPDPFLNPQ
ncbi:hypothetical protein [uncultured Phenylobacterium sp.]|uniref:hypothetical protein n=1 Tax=uncultured Phenylobacterium sp. TaxID=349273 RepID=UPI0025DBB1D2|nr:hypothetical protein [uncultured Phenylobacterium sp.]